jgi:hypothetical protein
MVLTAPEIYSQVFNDKGFSPRATSLAKSVVALTNDPSLLFYNPASIGFSDRIAAYTSFTNLYPEVTDANFNFFTGAGI